MYINDIKKGVCDNKSQPEIVKETVSTAFVNGNNVLGPVVGNFCMEIVIDKAKTTGVSWVCANGKFFLI